MHERARQRHGIESMDSSSLAAHLAWGGYMQPISLAGQDRCASRSLLLQAWAEQSRYQGGALHDGLLPAVGQGHAQLREVHQHLRHLVAALAAAHVDDAVAVAVLAERLADHGLAAAKGSWDGAGACGHPLLSNGPGDSASITRQLKPLEL